MHCNDIFQDNVKLLILALDGVPFEFIDRYLDELPNIASIIDVSQWGVLRAIDPPITIPAWACMFTGKDPGELGIYGFRHLRRGTYSGYIVTSYNLKVKYVWEELNLKSIVIGYEVAARIGKFLGRKHYEKIHATGTVGALSTTIALCKLLDLGKDTCLNALGICGCYVSGLWVQFVEEF